jgi:uncharacterized protein
MKRLIASAMLLGSLASNSMAIDCTKARKPSEVAICSDPQVRTCDLDLQTAYERLRSRITSAERRLVQIAEVQWINRRNASCGADATCLLRYCQDRTAVLDQSGWDSPAAGRRPVVEANPAPPVIRPTPRAVEPDYDNDGWPQGAVNGIRSMLLAQGGMSSRDVNCVLLKMQARMSFDQFLASVESFNQTGEMPASIKRSMMECVLEAHAGGDF